MGASMKKRYLKFLGALATLLPLGSFAQNPQVIILTEKNAHKWGLDFDHVAQFLNEASPALSNTLDSVIIKFHKESTRVDHSDFDGYSVTVDIEELSDAPTNLED